MDPVTIMDSARFNELEKNIKNLEKLLILMMKELKKEDPLLTSIEAQEYLKKGGTWLDANKHKIGCSRIGGEWRFRKSDLDDYIANHFFKE